MTDKELLELAAKAANDKNIMIDSHGYFRVIGEYEDGTLCMANWNPLTDDGDALRLAVKLRMIVEVDYYSAIANGLIESVTMGYSIEEATRRAIVRAAAEIGKGMK